MNPLEALDHKFLEGSDLRLLPAKEFLSVDPTELRLWMHFRAFYGIPTQELIEFLKNELPENSLEIGAARGDFCRFLGIRGIDSKNQNWPDVQAYYKLTGQPTIPYSDRVEEISAKDAIDKYSPDGVFGSWITQYGLSGSASMYGVDEEDMLTKVKKYVLFGSESAHGQKKILSKPHKKVKAPWMISRAAPELRCVYIWEM